MSSTSFGLSNISRLVPYRLGDGIGAFFLLSYESEQVTQVYSPCDLVNRIRISGTP
jgi:hypothetical protein